MYEKFEKLRVGSKNITFLFTGPIINVHAVAHKKATLPCDIIPPVLSDSTILVLWYKDLGDMPIYR